MPADDESPGRMGQRYLESMKNMDVYLGQIDPAMKEDASPEAVNTLALCAIAWGIRGLSLATLALSIPLEEKTHD